MEELKPCPFCGGEARMTQGAYTFWVVCEQCKAESASFFGEDDAAEAWNKRTYKGGEQL